MKNGITSLNSAVLPETGKADCNVGNSLFLCILVLFAAFSAMAGPGFSIPAPLPGDRRDIAEPAEVQVNVFENGYKRQITDQSIRFFDVGRQIKRLTGNRAEAMNVDAFDEVPNSSWYTNRHFQHSMSLDELKQGPHTHSGPDTTGEWVIWRAKMTGFAPGFFIKDAKEESYIIKFDPIGYSELSTSAEVVTTKFFYAAGYHVPENFVTVFKQERIRVGKKVKFTDSRGVKRYMTKADLDEIFTLVNRLPDGRIRCHASRFIKGKPIGPWKFHSTRKDDPNDIIPHQHRREVRAMRVIAAWLNHYDTNLGNTFDSYVEDNGRRYVRHYLIDFGSSLGSSVWGPMPATRGKENMIQPTRMLLNILTLGFWVHDWEKYDSVPHPSVGRWESHLFHPHKFKFTYPNLAFANLTDRDGFWGAKIVMSFSDEQIRALVSEGKYSNPQAEAYIARILMERRDKTGRYYFNRINPLDKFRLEKDRKCAQHLFFEDLAVTGGLEAAARAEYHWSSGDITGMEKSVDGIVHFPLPVGEFQRHFDSGSRFVQLRVKTKRLGSAAVRQTVVYFKKESGEYGLAGIVR